MIRVEKKLKLSDEKFKRRIGTTKPVFLSMLAILQTAHAELHQQGGKPPDLTPGDKLLITLKYYREYTTMEPIAGNYNCSKSCACHSIHWVEDILSSDGRFQMPGKQTLQEEELSQVVVDTTVQDKNITFPTDSKLLSRAIIKLGKFALGHGIKLRQSYARKAKQWLQKASGYVAARQFKRLERCDQDESSRAEA